MIQLINSLPLQYYAFSGLVNFFTAGIISLIVFISDKKSNRNRLFSAFSFSVAYWSLLYFVWLGTSNKEFAEFYLRSCMIGVLFMPSLFIHFVALFLKKKISSKFLLFNYLLSIIFTFTVYTPLYARDIGRHLVFPFWLHTGPVFHLAIIHFGTVVLYSFYLMWKAIKKESGIFRNQILYVFIGTAIGYIAGITNFFSWYRIQIPPFLNILVSVYVVLVAVAVLRYRLMDINLALTRAATFIFVYLFILGIPFWLGYRILGRGPWFIVLLFGMFLSTLGPFIYTYMSRRAEELVFKDQRRYQHALRELSKAMARIRDLDQLLKAITSTIIDNVRVGFAAIYVKDDEYKSYKLSSCSPQTEKSRFQEFIPLDYPLVNRLNTEKRPLVSEEIGLQDKIDLSSGIVIPCFMEDRLLAFIALGAKPNGQMYTPDDVLIFETLSYSTSLAIENSIFWREIEDRQRQARLQEMDTYSYSLAHEIDNPMQVILGHATLLKKALGKPNLTEAERKELAESLDFILECQQRVSTMVEAIRDFGQKATGEHMPLNIEEVVESFAQLYSPQFKANSVVFEKTSQLKEPVFVLGEKPELMQALVILANNAVHAMTGLKEKKVSLNIELTYHDWVRISFSDNGYGIKPENLKIIFKPFVTSKASTEGTGMGLHNALRIVERHKGRIWAESEGEGKGATFFIELPLAKEIKPEDQEDKGKNRRVF